jgi:hypothetical protein
MSRPKSRTELSLHGAVCEQKPGTVATVATAANYALRQKAMDGDRHRANALARLAANSRLQRAFVREHSDQIVGESIRRSSCGELEIPTGPDHPRRPLTLPDNHGQPQTVR